VSILYAAATGRRRAITMRTMQTKGAALTILALLLVSASCTSTKSAGPGPAESIIPVATEYGSMAEMQAVLAAAGLAPSAGSPT
jgi:hypothetical protein